MEIVLIVAIVAVAATGLYVAATFNKRTRQTTAPLIDAAVSDISAHLTAAADDLRRQLQAISTRQDQLSADLQQLAARLAAEPEPGGLAGPRGLA